MAVLVGSSYALSDKVFIGQSPKDRQIDDARGVIQVPQGMFFGAREFTPIDNGGPCWVFLRLVRYDVKDKDANSILMQNVWRVQATLSSRHL